MSHLLPDWKSDRLKDVSAINAVSLPADTDPDYEFDYLEISNVDYHGIVDPKAIERIRYENAPSRARRRVGKNCTVISSVRPNLQAVAFLENGRKDFVCSTGFNVIQPAETKLSPKFAYYALISEGARQYFEATAKGVGYPAVDDKDFHSFAVPLPPLPEQQRIAAYLDVSCAAIDAAVAAKRRQIETLDVLRKTIIHKIVTRGLDESVELKNSGVVWIGKIPSHWKVKRIKRYAQVKRGASPRPIADPIYFDDDGEYAWVRIADVSASGRYLKKTTQVLSELGASLSVKQFPGDLIISIAGTVGKPIITSIKCCIHDGFIWFDRPIFNKDYVYFIFMSETPYQGLGKLGTQLNLNTDTIGQIFIPEPPINELVAIIDFLNRKTNEIDSIQSNIHAQVKTLEQYRKSLVHECVTGRRRVTEADVAQAHRGREAK